MRFRAVIAFAFVAAACGGCGGATPATGPATSATSGGEAQSASGVDAGAGGPSATDDWRCGGELVPPTGWQQETAFTSTDTPNAREIASELAARKLTTRLCSASGGASCDYLAARVRPWKTGTNGTDVCAMAVLKAAEFEDWKGLATTLTTLDAKLDAAALDLTKAFGPNKKIVIDRIVDRGIPGGLRADWLRARMEHALQAYALLASPPRKWSGLGVPPGVDVVIRAEMVSRADAGVATLEASFTAYDKVRRVRSAAVLFPEYAAPAAPSDPAAPTLPEDEGISVRLDSDKGGSLCEGETSGVWVASDKPAVIRVVDLFGPGLSQGILMFPNEEVGDARLAGGGAEIKLTKSDLTAVPWPGTETERFIVLAAKSEGDLAGWGAAKGTCRLPSELVQKIASGKGLPPKVRVTSTGYRITTGPQCGATHVDPAQVSASINAIPLCAGFKG